MDGCCLVVVLDILENDSTSHTPHTQSDLWMERLRLKDKEKKRLFYKCVYIWIDGEGEFVSVRWVYHFLQCKMAWWRTQKASFINSKLTSTLRKRNSQQVDLMTGGRHTKKAHSTDIFCGIIWYIL